MQHLPRLARSLLLAVPFTSIVALSALTGCNEVETGAYGIVEFVPDDCGASWCDLDDGLAVDGFTDVYLNGVEGGAVDDLTIRTSSPSIAEVVDEDLEGLSPRVTIVGNRSGTVDLLAVDEWGYVVDYVTIDVVAPDQLQVDVAAVTGTSPDGPHDADGVDELYFVATGDSIELTTHALANGSPLMGRMEYSVVIGAELAQALAPGEDLTDGHLTVTPPAGEHTVMFATASAWHTVHFSVR